MKEEIKSLATVDETKKLFLATKESLGKMQKQITEKLAEKQDLARMETQIRKYNKDTFLSLETNISQQDKNSKNVQKFEDHMSKTEKDIHQLQNSVKQFTEELSHKCDDREVRLISD